MNKRPTDDSLLETLERGRQGMAALRSEITKVIVGHPEVIDGLFLALIAGGHVLFEGVPGLGKTLLVQTLSRALDLEFRRIQCTPDLMPADVIGTQVLIENPAGGRSFQFEKGPIFTQVLLADEINRATPKTQSALLEAMQERAVTVGGKRHQLAAPFFVFATQNPIEMEGTYPLPEAQLDRFFFKLVVKMPGADELEEIVDRTTGRSTVEVNKVLGPSDLESLQAAIRELPVPRPVKRYAVRLVQATHADSESCPKELRSYLRYGASPRAAQALILAAKGRAALDGRPNAAFEDIRFAAPHALAHRIVPTFEAQADGKSALSIVDTLLEMVSETETEGGA